MYFVKKDFFNFKKLSFSAKILEQQVKNKVKIKGKN